MTRKTQVLFTCDVECSLGNKGTFIRPVFCPKSVDEWIWGRFENEAREWGIELLMDQLDQKGMKGTFYVSALEKHFHGPDALEKVVQRIEERGHEVGVHIHCAWKGFDTGDRHYDMTSGYHLKDSIGDYDESIQRELLEEAVDLIRKWTGLMPRSFRAGNFGANRKTLKVLSDIGIATDSSSNGATGSLRELGTQNNPICVENLVEVPATTFYAIKKPRSIVRFVDPTNMTYKEVRSVLERVVEEGISTLVIVTHSFQYVAPGHVKNARVAPRPHLVRRVDRMLNLLAQDSRFESCAMRDLVDMDEKVVFGRDRVPANPAWMTAVRLIQSFSDGIQTI